MNGSTISIDSAYLERLEKAVLIADDDLRSCNAEVHEAAEEAVKRQFPYKLTKARRGLSQVIEYITYQTLHGQPVSPNTVHNFATHALQESA